MTISDLLQMAESSQNGQKTLGKVEIALGSNFSFSYSFSKRLLLQTCKNQGLFGKGLDPKVPFVSIFVTAASVNRMQTARDI